MSFEIGAEIMCDRCAKTVFVRCTGKGDEWTRSNHRSNYEEAPGWRQVSLTGRPELQDFCPECFKEYVRIINNFKAPPPEGVTL